MSYDFAVKQAVRHQQSLDEVLVHSTIEKVWKQVVEPAGAGMEEAEAETDGTSIGAVLVNLVPQESLTKLNKPENADKLEAIQQAAENAKRQVKSQVQTIDGSVSLERLAKQMREMNVCRLRGSTDSSVLIWYSIEAAGEHERDARRSPTPVRREFMEKIMKAVFATRAADLIDFEDEKMIFPALDPSDMCLVLGVVSLCFFSCS